jgi:hypothetical protein
LSRSTAEAQYFSRHKIQEKVMENASVVEFLGRAAAIEFTLGSIIKHLPADVRETVLDEIRLFLERSDVKHESGRATADAALSILKESGG